LDRRRQPTAQLALTVRLAKKTIWRRPLLAVLLAVRLESPI
jgi:hypothetical protein